MFGQLMQTATDELDESPEEEARRLEESAERGGVDPDSLYDCEKDVREVLDEIEAEMTQKTPDPDESDPEMGPIMGIFGMIGDGMIAGSVTRFLTHQPDRGARLVARLHRAFADHGIYEQAGIDPENPTQ